MADVTLKQLPLNVEDLVDPGFEEALCTLFVMNYNSLISRFLFSPIVDITPRVPSNRFKIHNPSSATSCLAHHYARPPQYHKHAL